MDYSSTQSYDHVSRANNTPRGQSTTKDNHRGRIVSQKKHIDSSFPFTSCLREESVKRYATSERRKVSPRRSGRETNTNTRIGNIRVWNARKFAWSFPRPREIHREEGRNVERRGMEITVKRKSATILKGVGGLESEKRKSFRRVTGVFPSMGNPWKVVIELSYRGATTATYGGLGNEREERGNSRLAARHGAG